MKPKQRWLATAIVTGALAIVGSSIFAAPQAPDNTKANEANRTSGANADQAKNNLSDREIMQRIRKSVMDEKSLSTYAHNVKIVSQHGHVTQKGPVRSDDEKRIIEEKAHEVAGSENVDNQITIKPARRS